MSRGIKMKTIQRRNCALLLTFLSLNCSVVFGQNNLPPAKFDSAIVNGLGIRNIGSATMSGRISALDAVEENGKLTLMVGAASGGVWKSSNGGTTFKPVFDKESAQSIGAVTIDRKNPKIMWVGTGESWTRNSVSIGDGVYKSIDGGESWSKMGLGNTERINKIVVNPNNSDEVFVCAPGKLWSDSADRGLYKTSDGGKSWRLILKGNNLSTGCSSITLDPKNANTMFAGLWDFRRQAFTFRSGGADEFAKSGSGLFKSVDGGETWTASNAENSKGLPAQPWGRVEIEYAPSDAKIVYAFIENKRNALYRSADGGQTWEERDRSQSMVWRPFYFSNLIIDPVNPERLFKVNLDLIASEDGGKSFSSIGGSTHGDHHDVWVNPKNTQHIITGDDGGLWISFDGGQRWNKCNNLPISQFYHVSTDRANPYRVYGGLQDNSSWAAENSYPGGVTNANWENYFGGDGFWMFEDPSDPDYIYAEWQGGNVARIHRATRSWRAIQPQGDYKNKLRYSWNTPIHLSPNEKGTIYVGAQYLFRSRDQGNTWEKLSPDLSTNDPLKQQQEKSGGITVDNSSAEMHTTIYSISESPKDAKVIWVGTDDGNVQVTRDGGKTWTNTVGNIRGLPKASMVSWVEASSHDPATAFAAFDRHWVGDMNPHAFITRDYGKTWTRMADANQGIRGYVHVVREDPVNANLVYLGTEFGLWISMDAGKNWAQFKGGNFPAVAVRDLVVQPDKHDLVLATHGRGIWIIDDITPLRAVNEKTLASEAQFLPTREITQSIDGFSWMPKGDATFVGSNAPGGAQITYYQRTRHLFGSIKLEIFDAKGNLIDTLPASKRKGINRVTWGLTVKPPRVPRAAQLAGNATQGPRVMPGVYTVKLTKGKDVFENKIEIGIDPRANWDAAGRQVQFDAAMRVHGLFGKMSDLVDRISAVQMQLSQKTGAAQADMALSKKIKTTSDNLQNIRQEIVATKEGGAITGEERIREHMDTIYGSIMAYEGAPGDYQVNRVNVLESELNGVASKFETFVQSELKSLNNGLDAAKLGAVQVPPQR